MKNKEKFKDEKEAREAHKKWCRDRAEQGWLCTQECTPCFEYWLDCDDIVGYCDNSEECNEVAWGVLEEILDNETKEDGNEK